jgi:hypothetical protein
MLRVSIAEQKYRGAKVARELTARQETTLALDYCLRQKLQAATAGVK